MKNAAAVLMGLMITITGLFNFTVQAVLFRSKTLRITISAAWPVTISMGRFYTRTVRMTFKWLIRRSQRKSFSWEGFATYLKRYPLPKPKIVHNPYTPSPVM
jgi:hypothetical protein